MPEAKEIAEARVRELARMPLGDLVELTEQPLVREVPGASGRAFREKSSAFWDMEPDDSLLYVQVRVRDRSLRALGSWNGLHRRDPDDLEGTASVEAGHDGAISEWYELGAMAALGLLVAVLIAPFLFAARFLAARRR